MSEGNPMETPAIREGLEDYAKSLDLSLSEVLALLEHVFNGEPLSESEA